MRAFLFGITIILLSSCKGPASKDSSAGASTQTETAGSETSSDSATVAGTVEEDDSARFTDEIDVNNWETFEAQNSTGVNLWGGLALLMQGGQPVEIYRLLKDGAGKYDFVLENSTPLSSTKTFTFKVQAYTYYVVKYKKLSALVPALAKDTVLPLVLNAESSIALNLFIRMMQTEDGQKLVEAQKISPKVLTGLGEVINNANSGKDSLATILTSVLAPVIDTQKTAASAEDLENAATSAIVESIIKQATQSEILSSETKSELQSVAASGKGPGSPSPVAPPGNRAPTMLTISQTSLAENLPAGSLVADLQVTDPDSGDQHTFAMVSGEGATDNGKFVVVGNQLKTAAAFDFEVKSTLKIRLRVSDSGSLSFEKSFVITVTDVNEAPSGVLISSAAISENQPANTVVGVLSAQDQDLSDSWTFALVAGSGDTDNASFNVSGSSLRASFPFDYESKAEYKVRIRATDAQGAFAEQGLTLTVTNVNETPYDLAMSNLTIDEGEPVNTFVGTLSASDDDAGSSLTYSLVAGTGSDDNASFNINGNSLRSSAVFSFATKSSYKVRIRVADNGTPVKFTETAYTVTVNSLSTGGMMHFAFYDKNVGRLAYMKGRPGNWGSVETVVNISKTNVDWENMSIALDSNDKPHVLFFSPGFGFPNGNTHLYLKPASTWQESNIDLRVNFSYGGTNSFIQGRMVSSDYMQIFALDPTQGNTTELFYVNPAGTGSQSYVGNYEYFNYSGGVHAPRSCVDDHDRLWFAVSETYASSLVHYGYRSGSADAYFSNQTSSVYFTQDPCYEDMNASSYSYATLEDMDCRGGKLTMLISCSDSGNQITRLKYVEKDISAAAAPNLSTSLAPQSFPNNPPFGAITATKAQIARTSTGAVRAVVIVGLEHDLRYFNGTTWLQAVNSPGVGDGVYDIAFTLDQDDRPHTIYVLEETFVNSKIMHWTHDGSSSTNTLLWQAATAESLSLAPELVIDSMQGKSNRN